MKKPVYLACIQIFAYALCIATFAQPLQNDSGSDQLSIAHFGFRADGDMWIRFKGHSSGDNVLRYGYRFPDDYNIEISPEQAKAMTAFLTIGIGNGYEFSVWLDANDEIGHIIYRF